MTIAAGPFAIAATLLVVAGAFKAARPADTANALGALGVPAPRLLVRAGAVVECAIGLAALISGDAISATLVGLSYVVFLVFVLEALRRHAPISSCGCFGKVDTPPSWLHVIVNLGSVAASVAVVLQPGAGLLAAVRSQPLSGAPYLLLVGTGAGLALLVLSAHVRNLALVRQPQVAR
jgi:hypothetical protein